MHRWGRCWQIETLKSPKAVGKLRTWPPINKNVFLTWVAASVSDDLPVLKLHGSPWGFPVGHLGVEWVDGGGRVGVKHGWRVGVAVGGVNARRNETAVFVAPPIVTCGKKTWIRNLMFKSGGSQAIKYSGDQVGKKSCRGTIFVEELSQACSLATFSSWPTYEYAENLSFYLEFWVFSLSWVFLEF